MRTPKYRTRRDKTWAFVEINGHRKPLPGKANSKESLDAYHSLCKELLASSGTEPQAVGTDSTATVTELVQAFFERATTAMTSGTIGNLRDAVRPLIHLYGETTLGNFSEDDLERVRNAAVSGSWIPAEYAGKCKAWSRRTANRHIGRIRQVFRWGHRKRIVSADTLQSVLALEPLRIGDPRAADRPPVAPAEESHVLAVLPHVSPVVAAMIQVQQLTGMRSGNLCGLRPCDIDTAGEVWVYRPPSHKTAWAGKSLAVAIGPRAMAILKPFMDRESKAYCFSPKESEAIRSEIRRQRRKAPVQPSQQRRKRCKNPDRPRGDRYRVSAYRRAIEYGINAANAALEKAGKPRSIPHWHPHQLRHAAGTLVRKLFSLDAAQVVLGHASANITEIYAQRDLDLAIEVAKAIG